jgi:hypothetical protein
MKNPFHNKIAKWFRLPFSLWSIDHFVVEARNLSTVNDCSVCCEKPEISSAKLKYL